MFKSLLFRLLTSWSPPAAVVAAAGAAVRTIGFAVVLSGGAPIKDRYIPKNWPSAAPDPDT